MRADVDRLSDLVAGRVEEQLAALETRIKTLEGVFAHRPDPDELAPVPAEKILGSFAAALAAAQAQIRSEAPERGSYAVGTLRAEVAAQLEVAEDGGMMLHLPTPAFDVQEGALTRLSFSVVPLSDEYQAAEVLVPIVIGQPLALATRQLSAAGLAVGRVGYEDSAGPQDVVLAQDPGADATLVRGGTVSLAVARNPRVVVPDLVGMREDHAIEAITASDLRRRTQRRAVKGVEPGTVVDQTPPAGEIVARRTVVRLTVSTAEPKKR